MSDERFPLIFSNPDLRRSELSLDAMLQRTSSNSSSSSSPSSQGGSAERRGTETQTHPYCNGNWHTNMLASRTIKDPAHVPALVIIHANADTGRSAKTFHVRWQGCGEFRRLSAGLCQSQFCSDQPVWCALLPSAFGETEGRKWERVMERGVWGCVRQQARGISKICMDLPLTNTWQRERLKCSGISFSFLFVGRY